MVNMPWVTVIRVKSEPKPTSSYILPPFASKNDESQEPETAGWRYSASTNPSRRCRHKFGHHTLRQAQDRPAFHGRKDQRLPTLHVPERVMVSVPWQGCGRQSSAFGGQCCWWQVYQIINIANLYQTNKVQVLRFIAIDATIHSPALQTASLCSCISSIGSDWRIPKRQEEQISWRGASFPAKAPMTACSWSSSPEKNPQMSTLPLEMEGA